MDIYVGNVSPKTTSWQLRMAFEKYGQVDKVTIDETPRDSDAYGFCFVRMPFAAQALRAIANLDGSELGGYRLAIRESGVEL